MAGPNDPWASNNIQNSVASKQVNNASKQLNELTLNDPWKSTPSISSSSASASSGSAQPNPLSQNISNNPWLSSASNTVNAVNKDPWSASAATASTPVAQPLNKLDEFDLFTSNRAAPSALTSNTNKTDDPFGDFFGTNSNINSNSTNSSITNKNTNPWNTSNTTSVASNSVSSAKTTTSMNGMSTSSSSTAVGVRKTPESFLGENSSLVNLENLIPSNRPKSTNPFGSTVTNATSTTNGLTSSTSSGNLTNNPFLAQAQSNKGPSINQLQNQATFSFVAPVTTTQNMIGSILPNSTSMTFNTNVGGVMGPPAGQLAQPLIIAPTPSSMPFMSTATSASGSGIAQPASLFPLLPSNQFQQSILAAPTVFNSSPLNANPIASSSMPAASAASTNPFLMM
jgi:hypothetical protein